MAALFANRSWKVCFSPALAEVFGFLLAASVLQWLVHARPDIPRAESIHIDAAVFLFTTIVMLVCGLLAGLIPSLSSSDKHILQSLHQSSRSYSGSKSSTQLRRILLSVQVGMTVVLLIGAGLLIKSYRQLRLVDLGCATENVLTMRIKLPQRQLYVVAAACRFRSAVARPG